MDKFSETYCKILEIQLFLSQEGWVEEGLIWVTQVMTTSKSQSFFCWAMVLGQGLCTLNFLLCYSFQRPNRLPDMFANILNSSKLLGTLLEDLDTIIKK